jgi:Cysteine-rich CPCC
MDAPGVRCPCCGFLTLTQRNAFEICPVCFWEDDGQDDVDAEDIRGGPNRSLSLTEARRNFRSFGACDESVRTLVRPPNSDEMPETA